MLEFFFLSSNHEKVLFLRHEIGRWGGMRHVFLFFNNNIIFNVITPCNYLTFKTMYVDLCHMSI